MYYSCRCVDVALIKSHKPLALCDIKTTNIVSLNPHEKNTIRCFTFKDGDVVIKNHQTKEVCTVHFQPYNRVKEHYKMITGTSAFSAVIPIGGAVCSAHLTQWHLNVTHFTNFCYIFRRSTRFKWSCVFVIGWKLRRLCGIYVCWKRSVTIYLLNCVRGFIEHAKFSGLTADPIQVWKAVPKPEISPRLVN